MTNYDRVVTGNILNIIILLYKFNYFNFTQIIKFCLKSFLSKISTKFFC